jgi:hypothetical protein
MRAWQAANPEYTRLWHAANREKVRDLQRRRLYGMNPGDFKRMLAEQNNCCAICARPFLNSKNTNVDHDHASGRIRGILCGKCNRGLGYFGDNLAGLQRAVDYLKRFESNAE